MDNKNTRVWIYQNDQAFSDEILPKIKEEVAGFCNQWASHGKKLQASGEVLYNRFIILKVNQSYYPASGCSIDSSVAFIRTLEEKYDLNLFDRMNFSFVKDHEVHTVNRQEFKALFAAGQIGEETLVFDNLVDNEEKLSKEWIKPLKESWHKRMV